MNDLSVCAACQEAAGQAQLPSQYTAPQTLRPLERAIGHHIRRQRRRLNLTGGDLASAANISASMLSKIENGQISPSLATLQALASALNLPLTALFASHEGRKECSLVKAGEGTIIDKRGSRAGHIYQRLGHTLNGDITIEPYLVTMTQSAAPFTAFRHDGIEIIYMLSGRVIYQHAGNAYSLAKGDTLMFHANAAHGPQSLVELPLSYLSIVIATRA